MDTLFNKLGGQQGIDQIVDEFYKRIMADSTLNPFFAHTNMDKQRHQQATFFYKIFDGPDQYNGRTMETTHTGMNLQQPHFDAIVKHLNEAVAVRGLSREDTNAVLTRVASLKDAILNR
ncbi:MAG: group 1 truncated hemoglobin [Rhizonema sp. PD37]|nr:group 1 truncated hemoglobin [Rhizonema sp. PD37]